MNVALRNWHTRQHRFVSHAIVSVRMIRRHVTFVGPEEVSPGPRHVEIDEELIKSFRCRTARQRDGEEPLLSHRFATPRDEVFSGPASKLLRIREDLDHRIATILNGPPLPPLI